MRFLYWLYALAACALCAFLFLHVRRAESADPRALLEQARVLMSGPKLDLVQAGHDLDAALAAAERDLDRPLVEEILIQRSRLARQSRAWVRAKADLETVLNHHRPGSPAIEAMLAGVLLESGELEEALARADRVLAKDRNQTEAWGVRAEAVLALAQRVIDDCVRRSGVLTAEFGLKDTEALMRRIAARPVDDATRLRLSQELYERYPNSEKELARDIQTRLDDASALLAQAPEALMQSLKAGLRPSALIAYVQALLDAGEEDAAANLGQAALSFPPYAAQPALLRLMLRVLPEAGREAALPELITPDVMRRVALDTEFYAEHAAQLLALERWAELAGSGNQMRRSPDPDVRALGDFYVGLSFAKRKVAAESVPLLSKYVRTYTREPFPDAFALAWISMAEALRAQPTPDTATEADFLRRGLAAASTKLPNQHAGWLRLVEIDLEAEPPHLGRAMDAITRALELAPQEAAQLEPRWREIGARFSKSRRVDFELEAQALSNANQLAPQERRVAFECVMLGEVQFAAGQHASALALAGLALEQHPRLLPALRLASDAALAAQSWSQAARHLRERIAAEGAKPELVEALANLPEEVQAPGWKLALVRLDPGGIGRRWAADDLRERGELAAAIESLERVAPARRSDADHLLLAELYAEQGQLVAAQTQLARLTADAGLLAKAAPLMITIAARQRDAEHVRRILRLLKVKVELDVDAFIDALDELMVRGLYDVAAEACELLDSRARWRSPRLHLRLAQLALLANDFTLARESLERALAYDEHGSAELGLLITAVQERRWGDCADLHETLLKSEFQATGLQFAALAALGERLGDARLLLQAYGVERRAEESLAADAPATALEALVTSCVSTLSENSTPSLDPLSAEHGFGPLPAGAVQRDPRALLARLAALDDPEWTAWAVADLARQTQAAETERSKGGLWPAYLASRGAAWLGAYDVADALARKLTKLAPKFAPGWNVLEQVVAAQTGDEDAPQRLQVARERKAALGASDPLSGHLVDARLARVAKSFDAAQRSIDAAFALAPYDPKVLRERERVALARGAWSTAIESARKALDLEGERATPRQVREFVDLLARARQAQGAALDGLVRAQFDALTSTRPDDPWVRIEALRFAYPLDSAQDRWTGEHALSELENLRRRLPHGVESEQPGAAVRWAEYYARLDPRRALQLLELELEHAPHSAALWSAHGELAAQLGRFDEATESFEVSLGISPTALAAQNLVAVCARRNGAPDAVQAQIARAAVLGNLGGNDRHVLLARARALLRADRARLGEGLVLLAQLWASRDPKAREAEMLEIGTCYGAGLCRRSAAGDAALAIEVFAQIAPRVKDPLAASELAALRSLAATLRDRR